MKLPDLVTNVRGAAVPVVGGFLSVRSDRPHLGPTILVQTQLKESQHDTRSFFCAA